MKTIKLNAAQSIRLYENLTGTVDKIPARLKKALMKHRKRVSK